MTTIESILPPNIVIEINPVILHTTIPNIQSPVRQLIKLNGNTMAPYTKFDTAMLNTNLFPVFCRYDFLYNVYATIKLSPQVISKMTAMVIAFTATATSVLMPAAVIEFSSAPKEYVTFLPSSIFGSYGYWGFERWVVGKSLYAWGSTLLPCHWGSKYEDSPYIHIHLKDTK